MTQTNPFLKNKIIFFSIFSLFLASFTFTESYAASYLKLDGIKGEATDDEHKDWIIIQSMSSPLQSDEETNVVHLTKKLDYSSAAISESVISGKIHPRAILETCDRGEECQRFDLTNVLFTGYSISATGDQRPMEEISFVYTKISQPAKEKESTETTIEPTQPERPAVDDIPAAEIVEARVPTWVQTTASFWVDGNVSDREFTDGIGYLVKEKIINLDEKVESSGEEPSELKVPSWIKDATKWWIDGQVPEDQFLESIKWLIKNKIIIVPVDA